MTEKKISLQNIAAAIRINCLIDSQAGKPLTLVKLAGKIKNTGAGRSIFIFFALQAGYDQEAICDYLDMTADEFSGKLSRLPMWIQEGQRRFEEKQGPENPYRYFWRKFILVRHYLSLCHQFNCDLILTNKQ